MRRMAFVVLALVSAGVLSGGINRWVDEHGGVHYGDAPPSGVVSESVKLRPAYETARSNPRADDRKSDIDELLQEIEQRAEQYRKEAEEASRRRQENHNKVQRLEVGMQANEVIGIVGRYPDKIHTTSNAGGTREQWVFRYPDNWTVYVYVHGGVVTAVQY